MNTFSTVAEAAKAALAEIDKGNQGEGGTDLTGKVYMDMNSEALWFQVEDDTYHNTNWISMDFPEYAAPGEVLVVAADEHDMLHFDENRQPPAPVVTYCVLANEIDNEIDTEEVLYSGLTRAEALATATSARDMGEPDKYNYYIGRDDQR